MQQIFPCPTCGAQNFIGQEFCQACGQKFQYNCPHCGVIVDATLVNCPGCRESLFWPTPQRVKPFPKQQGAYQRAGDGGEEGTKAKKKSDPWVTGCLGLVIIGILFMVAYLVYDYINSQSLTLPGETGFNQMQFQEFEPGQDVSTIVYKVNEMQTWL
jgi:hypothetical protein